MQKTLLTLAILILCLAFPFQTLSAGQKVDNQIFTRLLQQYVNDGNVDYEGFKKDEKILNQYLDILSRTDIEKLSKKGKFAFYVNAYNAFTIKLILTRYPDIESIKDIGGLFSSPWDMKFIPLKNKKVTLDYIEHEVLRPTFKDARVHFAVNCASKSCPPLRNEAYEEDRLDDQLNEQTRQFINGENNYSLKGNSIYISKIFKWFKKDFNNTPLAFVMQYAQEPLKEKLEALGSNVSVRYLDYDWSLNN